MHLLLDNGAKLHANNESKETALYIAAQRQYEVIVKLLLDHEANVDAKIKSVGTALYAAVETGNKSSLKLLQAIDYGSYVSMMDTFGDIAP